MNGFLLDTNVVSELTRTEPDSNVIAFLSEHQDLWLSAVVLHELEFGLQLLPDGQRRDLLSAALAGIITEYQDRILPVDREVAERAAVFRAQAHRGGRAGSWGCAHRRNRQGTRSVGCNQKRRRFQRPGRPRHQSVGTGV